jgi:IS30 family transposase
MHTKKLATSKISDEEIRMNQNRSNNRTRKRLGMKTPAEDIYKTLKHIALKT